MFGEGRVVKQGTFCYAGQVTCDVCIQQTDVRYGTGDYEDAPEDRDDLPGEWYYIWYSPAGTRGDYRSGGPSFPTLNEAIQHLEATVANLEWLPLPYPSTKSPTFLSTVQTWIEASGEVFTLIRFHASAGSKSFEFFHSLDAFTGRLRELQPRTCVTVFRSRQLPLRGQVDEEFIRQTLVLIAEGTEYLVVTLERTTMGATSWFHDAAGESHAELIEDLRNEHCYGKQCAVGSYPPWLEDNESVISAVVPKDDGTVIPGIY